MGVSGRKPDLATQRDETDPAEIGGSDAVRTFPPPDDLTEDAKELWRLLVTDMAQMGVYRESDGPLLSELVSSLAMAQEFRWQVDRLQQDMREALDADDHDKADGIAANLKRARTGYRQMMQTVMSIAGEFGVSPTSRLRLGLMQVQGTNSLLDLAERQREGGR